MVVGGPKQAIPLPDHVGHVMLTYHQGGRGRGRGRGGSLPTGRNIKINYTGKGTEYLIFPSRGVRVNVIACPLLKRQIKKLPKYSKYMMIQ